MPEAGACEQLAQSQVSEIVDPASEVLDSKKLDHALVDLLGQLLIGCPDYPAARIRPPLFPKLRYVATSTRFAMPSRAFGTRAE